MHHIACSLGAFVSLFLLLFEDGSPLPTGLGTVSHAAFKALHNMHQPPFSASAPFPSSILPDLVLSHLHALLVPVPHPGMPSQSQ